MKILSLALISSLLTSSALFGVTLNPTKSENSLVIYNSGVALVHEKRELSIKKDESKIIYEDVASSIDTDSVNIILPKSIELFSQQYRFDKLTKNKLLNAYIGKDIEVKVKKDANEFKIIKAKLLSNDGVNAIIKTMTNYIITVDTKNIIFKNIPSELITKPSLVWNVKAKENLESKISIDYLIKNIRYKSDYILNLNQDKADLSGWITINNRSGKSFKNTSLNILAGDINRARENKVYYNSRKVVMAMDSAPSVKRKAFEGYHFYSIPFKVDISNNEKTQIKFVSQKGIDIKRKYSVRMSNPNHIKGEMKHSINQYVTIEGLKYPLPKGVVRTYSKLKGVNILLGESSINHTPKDSKISLLLGKNFDIKATETLINYDKSTWSIESDLKYSIKNSSNRAKTVEILIPFNNNEGSKVQSDESYSFTKGNMVTFNIRVKADSTKEFNVSFKTKR
jgi:hypothetical protein